MKRNILTFLLIIIALVWAEAQSQPNVVIILTDDMGYGDLGCYSPESKIATPNIDALAESGIMFRDAHAAGAWCVPSRYGMVTGRYPRLMPLKVQNGSLIKPEQETVATVMKRADYTTACVGKWHLGFDSVDFKNPTQITKLAGGPVDHGFDYFFGMHASLDIPPYFYIENDKPVMLPTETVEASISADATSPVSGAFWRKGAISPDFKHEEVLDKFLEKATGFVDSHLEKNADKPFFLYFPFTAPHTPWLPKKEFVGKSGAGEYGDFVMQVDDVVGQFVAHLKKKNQLENTIIIFSSDNGPVWFSEDVKKFNHKAVGNLRGIKSDMWEGGSRMPFIVRYPKKYAAGVENNQMIGFTDVIATLADIVGDKKFKAEDFDSHSFLPALLGDGEKVIRKDLVMEKKVYREGDWKYIDVWGQGGIELKFAPHADQIERGYNKGELYNLAEDLSETNNLIDKYPKKAAKMKKKLHEILAEEM